MRVSRGFAVVLCAVLIAAAAPAVAFAAPHAEGAVAPARRSSVIVAVSDAARMAAVRSALERSGGLIRRVYRWNAFLVSAPLGMDSTQFSAKARGIGGVRYAEGNSTRHAYATANDPLFPQQWGLPDIGAPTAWDSTEGSGVAVAVIDTGIDSTHPDLSGNVVLFKNYVNPAVPPTDDNNHGTHVAGIIAAIRNNAIDGVGTAPKTKVYALKVLDASGDGSDADVASAIRDAVDLTPCRILSMSLGGPDNSQALADAVSYARSKGALVIAAAGNSNSSTPSYPAALPGVIGVGAVSSNNVRASFSNYGAANCDIVAPGVNILSTVLGGGTAMESGTSMATPFVSGCAALVWARNPMLDATGVANLLQNTAQDLGALGVDQFYGHGLVRVDLALAASPSPDTTPTASALTIRSSRASAGVGQVFVLSGLATPSPGMVGLNVHVDVKKPGKTYWSYSSNRTVYSNAGVASWLYKYTFKRGMVKGTYQFKAGFDGNTTFSASLSGTIGVVLR
jgi:thermitase